MPILESQVDTNSDEYKRNREKMLAAIAEFRAAEASVQATSEKSRARFAKRKQLMPRERIALLLDRGAPFLELMPLAGYRMHDDKDGSSAGGGSVAGIGYVEGVRCVVSASNSAIKGGTVAPSGQRKGQRVQQIVMENKLPLVHLVESGGANLLVPGRDLRAGRPRLRQPGAHVGARHPAGHRRARLVDGGRRLPARPLRLRHHGAQPGQGVPGRPAAPQGRDRRDRDRRGAGRRRDARHRVGRRRMDGRERRRRHPHGARGHRQVALERQAAAQHATVVQGPALRHRRALRRRSAVVQGSLRRARGDRPPGRRLGLPRIQGPLRPADDLRLGRDRGRAGGLHRQQRADHHQGLGQGRAIHPALLPAGHAHRLSAEHHGLHGRHRGRARRHRQARLQDDPGGGQRHGAAGHHRDRRLVRRRQLRHVRPRLRSALHLRLAQQPHRRHGRRAGGRRDEDRDRAEIPARRQGAAPGRDRQDVQGHRRPVRPRIRRRSTAPRICGTTASSTRATRAASWPSPCRSPANRWCGRSIPSPSASQGCRDEVHARTRSAAPDLEDADRPRDQSACRRMGEGGHVPRP